MKLTIKLFVIIMMLIAVIGVSYAQEKVTIDVYGVQWLPGHLEEMPKIIAKFNETHPNIRINYIQGQWAALKTMMTTGAAAGNLPDLINLETSTAMEFGERGALVDLNEFLTDEIRAQLLPTAIEGGLDFNEEHVWYLGDEWEVNSLVYYNAGLLKDSGIEPPARDQIWSYEQGREAMKKVTDPAFDRWGLMQNVTMDVQEWFIPALWCWGSDIFVKEGDNWRVKFGQEAVDVLKFFNDLVVVDKSLSSETAGISTEGMVSRFIDGKLGFVSWGPWFWDLVDRAAGEDLEWGVMHPWNEKKTVTQVEATGYAMAANTKHKKEAWEVLWFLMTDETKKPYNKKGRMFPTSKVLIEDPMFQTQDDFMDVQLLAAQSGRQQTKHPVFEGLHKEVMIPFVGMMFNGEMTPEQVAQVIENEGNYLIQEMQGR
ncbi:extracellular solute-binding protein [Atribacter laminatus]|uniref:ABC transporter substrate-binding protein YesO n=1 Tax=Atribacter laminatus TaxID=2847778 RepID=A0A7T1ALK2_ATRLM|nr:extracellular solute-binding protein [Atribacter laminatus]QPM68141.1 Putative ABC transporter substrate-binding protein YesO [Atribacter laminatus]